MASYFDKFKKGAGVPFMEDAVKIDIPINEPLTITDYGFIANDEGDFVVLQFAEYPNSFAFGNSIATETIHTIEEDFSNDKKEILAALATVKVLFQKVKSKKGRFYTSIEFIEDVNVPF